MVAGRLRRVCRGLVMVSVLVWGGTVLLAQGLATYEQINVTSSAVGIATATLNPSGRQQMNRCEMRVESGAVRYRDDGTDPTASIGFPLETDDAIVSVDGNAYLRRLRFIRSGGANGVLSVRCTQ